MHFYIFSNAFLQIWIPYIQSVIYSDNLRTYSKIPVWFLEKSINKHSFLSKSMALLTFIAFTFRRVKWKSPSCLRLFATPWAIQSMEFSRSEYWSGDFPSPGYLPNPATEPGSPALQVDSLPAEISGKPKNTGVGSLIFLQQIFLTQELNCDLLHWRRIFYQLNYQGSPLGGYSRLKLKIYHQGFYKATWIFQNRHSLRLFPVTFVLFLSYLFANTFVLVLRNYLPITHAAINYALKFTLTRHLKSKSKANFKSNYTSI